MSVNHYEIRHYYKSMARILDHEVRTGQRRPGMDCTRAAALAIEDCEAEGRVTPKEINEAVENVLRIFMENVEERIQARKAEYLREMRMRRGETVCDEWEEGEHPRKENGEFTFKGTGRSGGSAKPPEHYEEPESDFESLETPEEGSSHFGPGREQLVAAAGNTSGILPGNAQSSTGSQGSASSGNAKPAGWDNPPPALNIWAGGPDIPDLEIKLTEPHSLPGAKYNEKPNTSVKPAGWEKIRAALKIWAGKPDIPALGIKGMPSTVPPPLPGKKYSESEIREFTERYNRFRIEFEEASIMTGIPVDVLVAFAIIESGIEQKESQDQKLKKQGKSDKNASTAEGIMQITKETRGYIKNMPEYNADYVLDLEARGRDTNIYLGALRLRQIAQELHVDLTDPDTRNIAQQLRPRYFLGSPDAKKLKGLGPDEPVSNKLKAGVINGNPAFFKVNGRPATRREAEKLIGERMDKGYAAGIAIPRDE